MQLYYERVDEVLCYWKYWRMLYIGCICRLYFFPRLCLKFSSIGCFRGVFFYQLMRFRITIHRIYCEVLYFWKYGRSLFIKKYRSFCGRLYWGLYWLFCYFCFVWFCFFLNRAHLISLLLSIYHDYIIIIVNLL